MSQPTPYTPTSSFTMRPAEASDLPVFFENQLDPVACQMAAFTSPDPSDRAAYNAKWTRILHDQTVMFRTVLVDGLVAGSVLSWQHEGTYEVSYWLGRTWWGQGLATRALAEFLTQQTHRPLQARVAADNAASLRVLQKCGFVIIGKDRGFANARGCEIEEYVLELGA